MGIHLEAADYIGARFGEEGSREDFLKEVIIELRDFPGGPVAKTPSSQCRGPGFYSWLRN